MAADMGSQIVLLSDRPKRIISRHMELRARVRRSTVAVTVVLAIFFTAACSQGAPNSPLRDFSYTGAGTNVVTIQSGQLSEHWSGRANPFGNITTQVTGRVSRPTPTSLAIQSRMVIVDPSGDQLVGTCTGQGVAPTPQGHEDWTCMAQGDTGKFKQSRGQWTLHIEIFRVSNANGVQNNRFIETGTGRISWNA
jgi:hypothetical protein